MCLGLSTSLLKSRPQDHACTCVCTASLPASLPPIQLLTSQERSLLALAVLEQPRPPSPPTKSSTHLLSVYFLKLSAGLYINYTAFYQEFSLPIIQQIIKQPSSTSKSSGVPPVGMGIGVKMILISAGHVNHLGSFKTPQGPQPWTSHIKISGDGAQASVYLEYSISRIQVAPVYSWS